MAVFPLVGLFTVMNIGKQEIIDYQHNYYFGLYLLNYLHNMFNKVITVFARKLTIPTHLAHPLVKQSFLHKSFHTKQADIMRKPEAAFVEILQVFN